MSVSFIKKTLDLLAPQDKRYSIGDPKTPGLRLMIYPTGKKAFILQRRIKGRPVRMKIGNYADISIENARKVASQHNSIIGIGEDPYQEGQAKRKAKTFKDLYKLYYEEHALLHTKRPEDNKRLIEFHVFPKIGNLACHDISRDRIRELHRNIGTNRGKAIANRVITIVNACFNFAIRTESYRGLNPCRGLSRFKTASRDRFLSITELKAYFESVQQEEELFRDYFLLLLYTGVRKSNLRAMTYSSIDFERKQWRISENDTKNAEVNIVSLSDPALTILQRRLIKNNKLPTPSPYVFPGEGAKGFLNDPKRAFSRIKARMDVKDFRMHDLRRTLGSHMAINGSSLLTIGAVLNHKDARSTKIYARLSHSALLDAINKASEVMIGNLDQANP